MNQKSFIVTFEKPWLEDENTVEGLLQKLDFGEAIPITKLQEACKREGKKFIIKTKYHI